MSKTIWKYELLTVDNLMADVPKGAEFLPYVELTYPYSMLVWAMVDPQAEKVSRRFAVVGTGHPLSDEMLATHDYVGTARDLDGGFLVFHVFIGKESM